MIPLSGVGKSVVGSGPPNGEGRGDTVGAADVLNSRNDTGMYDELQTKPKQRKYMPSQYAKQKLTGSWMVKMLAQMSEIQ